MAKEKKDDKKDNKEKAKSNKDKEVIKLAYKPINELRAELNIKFKDVASPAADKPISVMSTGILSMDLAIDNGGYLTGRVSDINGWEGTGKTMLCMAIGGAVQRQTKTIKIKNKDGDLKDKVVKRIVAFVDAEGTFSKSFAESVGLSTDSEVFILIQSTPDEILYGEKYFDIMKDLIAGGVDYIIVDSCPALTPKQVIVNEIGQGQKAPLSQLMASGLSAVTPLINAFGQTHLQFINQRRGKPMASQYEASEQETGGNALKFYSSYRFQVINHEDIVKNVLCADGSYSSMVVGVTSRVKITKNKTSSIPACMPGKSYHFEYDVYFESFEADDGVVYSRGVDIIKDFVETGVRTGVIQQNSSWFKFGELNCNGKAELTLELRNKPEILGQIREAVYAKMSAQIEEPKLQVVQ
jgi:recombination protein RecA